MGSEFSSRSAWGSTSRIAPSCSTHPFGEPGVLQMIDWPRIAQMLGVELREGESFDPVELGLVSQDYFDLDSDHKRSGEA